MSISTRSSLAETLTGCPVVVPARYVFATLSAVSFAIIYGLKANLSVAIVAMVNWTAVQKGKNESDSGECPKPPSTEHMDGPFLWTESLQGHILGSYFYGYLVSEIPGAYMAEYWSAKWVMMIAVTLNIVCCSVTPVVCHKTHFGVFIMLRVIQGFGGGLTFPAMHEMIARWAPPHERSVISGVIYAGTALGTVGSTLLAGYLAHYLGWEWVFYIMALLSVPWLIFWIWAVSDTPASSRCISEKERNMIHDSLGDRPNAHDLHFPLQAVFSSLPFWAILLAHFCSNCGWYMILTQLPSFMKHVLHKNMKENSGMSALPYFLMWVVSVVLGTTLDKLVTDGRTTITTARKIATGIASVIPLGCLVGISFIGCNDLVGTILIIIAVTALGAMFVGFLANHIDLSPNYAGMLMAITNTIGTLPGIFMPLIVGRVVEGNQTLGQWSKIFYVVAALYAFMFIFYSICASGETQTWNEVHERSEDTERA